MMTEATEAPEAPHRLAGTHPAREAFADCSGIYERITRGISIFNDTLRGWGYHLDHEGMMDFNVWGGGTRLSIYDYCGRKFGCAYFEWEWVGDGWEVLGRIGKHA